ncbi:MAG TPA: glycosyltransferase family 4 protein, partial [Stellaceae bacterium]|nr:glycosyltransferase family 4 protein [Stellaceae bacterium]
EKGSGAGEPPHHRSRVAASPPRAPRPAGGPAGKGTVCILTRKRINNITRAPRMAKALVDAGWDVVVVATGLPVLELQEMCPQVEYIGVTPRAATIERRRYWQERRWKQNSERARRTRLRRAALAKGGLRAFLLRTGGTAAAILRPVRRALWEGLVAAPSALLLKTGKEGFAATWRKLAGGDVNELATHFAMVSHQWALTHAFADEAVRATQSRRFDAVQAYDNYALVAAARLAARDGAKLIYDAVELTTHRLGLDLNPLERVRERFERREEARICRHADGMVAVGEALSDWCARQFRRPRPVVVRNCRYHWPYRPDSRLRDDAGVGAEARLLIWCGAGYPDQGIEFLIKALPYLPAHVHAAIVAFYQPAWAHYGQQVLPGLAYELGVGDRVHFLPAREPNDLVPYVSGADIGVIPSWGAQINNLVSLPNKFHEMVMARLPLASSRRGEVVDMIKKHEIGDVVDECDLAKTASVITAMLEPQTYARYKMNVMCLAEELTWENESRNYTELFDRLVRPATAADAGAQSRRAAAE